MGGDGGGPPRAALFGGGGKIEVIPKNLERVRAFRGGDILGRGYKRGVDEKFRGIRQKYRGAANLRSAPGGRHPSYATEYSIFLPKSLLN